MAKHICDGHEYSVSGTDTTRELRNNYGRHVATATYDGIEHWHIDIPAGVPEGNALHSIHLLTMHESALTSEFAPKGYDIDMQLVASWAAHVA